MKNNITIYIYKFNYIVSFRPLTFFRGYFFSKIKNSEILTQQSTTVPEAIMASTSEKLGSEVLLGHGGHAFYLFFLLVKNDIVNVFVTCQVIEQE